MVTKKEPKKVRQVKLTKEKKEIAKPKAEKVRREPVTTAPLPAAIPKFISAVGRRKTARARVRMTETGQGLFTINARPLKQYFGNQQLVELALSPLKAVGEQDNHDFSVKIVGGGVHSQAEAVRHGLARALVQWNGDFRKTLRSAGFLTRDPREKERKKPGLKKARRAPQWAKR